MPHSPTSPRPLAYSEVVRTLNDKDIQDDMNDACGKLAHAMGSMMEKVDSIAKQMHTIDLLRVAAPLKSKWEGSRRDLSELLWQFRTNSGVISGRLKLFTTSVLPLIAQISDGRSDRSHNESLQVLQSFMTISAEHAALTRSLLDRVFRFSAQFAAFVSDFTKLASRHATSEVSTPDPIHVLYTSGRLIASSNRPSKLTRRPLLLDGNLTEVGKAYEQIDHKRGEVVHAQYAAQLRQSRTDPLASAHNTLCAFLLEVLLTSESALSLFVSIWARLRSDCSEIFHWLKSQNPPTTPLAISCYCEKQLTLYTPLATALDLYSAALEPVPPTIGRRDAH